MINWMYFPRNIAADKTSLNIIDAFTSVLPQIDSSTNNLASNDVLAHLYMPLSNINFIVESGKSTGKKVHIPVLFGLNGKTQLSFDADAFNLQEKYVIEVEAGRAFANNQFLKDFFEACAMHNVDYLCIAVRNEYRNIPDFKKICAFFDALYASGRLQVPLKGLLIIGY